MASIKQQQQDAMASIDTAKAMLDKVLTILGILEDSPSLTLTFATNPIGFLLQMLEHLGVTYEELRLWLTNFLIYVLPALEIAVKAILLTNLKKMVSCSIDPRIPDKYRKLHKAGEYNTSQEYGIDINVESIDFLNKLATSPLSDEGSEMYFGLEGVTDVYKFARADDMDAFLWFVIHKAHFPNSTKISDVRDILTYRIDPSSEPTASIKPKDCSLLDAFEVDAGQGQSSILPGNTFAYTGQGNIISMCIDAKRESMQNKILKNTMVPVSDDWNSANWYIRRADQLGKNLGFGWEVNDENGNTKYSGEGRDYSKERGICNLQYLDQSLTEDSPITGLVNNKIRFSILPKPYIHVPNIDAGEPLWRFKKMLFNSQGQYDPNGKYTFAQTIGETVIEENGEKYIKFTNFPGSTTQFQTDVRINVKSGEVTVKVYDDNRDPRIVGKKFNPLVLDLYECYPGLTVYEFNYDYVMGMKLFDAKVIVTTLLDALIDARLGLSVTFGKERQEAIDELKEIIKNVINSDDSSVSDCFFTFDNAKYEALLRKSEEKRARQQRFGNVTEEVGSFANVREVLEEYDANAELHKQVEVLNRAITQASVNITEGVAEKDKYKVEFDFVTDIIEQLTFAIVSSIFSPKVLMLLEVNETLMGGKWEKITMRDLIEAMRSIILAIVEEIRDLIVQELMKLVLKYLEPIIQMLTDIMLREQVEAYTDAIMEILRNCPFFWFSFGNRDLETKLDTVDYADIDTSMITKDKPNLNNC